MNFASALISLQRGHRIRRNIGPGIGIYAMEKSS